jgi:hypothetical protein
MTRGVATAALAAIAFAGLSGCSRPSSQTPTIVGSAPTSACPLVPPHRLYEYYSVPASLSADFVAAQPHPWSRVGKPRLVDGGVAYQRIG